MIHAEPGSTSPSAAGRRRAPGPAPAHPERAPAGAGSEPGCRRLVSCRRDPAGERPARQRSPRRSRERGVHDGCRDHVDPAVGTHAPARSSPWPRRRAPRRVARCGRGRRGRTGASLPVVRLRDGAVRSRSVGDPAESLRGCRPRHTGAAGQVDRGDRLGGHARGGVRADLHALREGLRRNGSASTSSSGRMCSGRPCSW